MKEIKLKHDNISSDEVSEITRLLCRGEPVVLVPSNRKTIKLSDLPEGTVVDTNYGKKYLTRSGHNPIVADSQTPSSYRETSCASQYDEIHIIEQKEWTVWHGEECPFPAGVECKVLISTEGGLCEMSGADVNEYNWKHNTGWARVIAYRITGQVDGYTLISE